jgi:hypothetical protein
MSATDTAKEYAVLFVRGIGLLIGAIFMAFPIAVIYSLQQIQNKVGDTTG